MTKKFLFGMMSLAALAACTNDDFESTKVAEGKGNVQFVVINDDATTRASMGGTAGTAITWNSDEGDKFTLYHGAELNKNTGFQNATFTASKSEGKAVLKTPSMILPNQAIMVYPADLLFNVKSTDELSIQIPEELEDVAKSLPYVSDGIKVGDYSSASSSSMNTSGYDKQYPIFMRPMASQLILNTDYVGMDKIEALYDGEEGVEEGEGIKPIEVSAISVNTKSGGSTLFTQKIKLTLPSRTNSAWSSVEDNSWNAITTFGDPNIKVATLKSTAKYSKNESLNDGCTLLFLPQAEITVSNAGDGVDECAVVVETQYGKVVVEKQTDASNPGPNGGNYTTDEIKDAWYRLTTTKQDVSATYETEEELASSYKYTSYPATGLAQTLNYFKNKKGTSTINGEEVGAAVTRYVTVYLKYLDMSDLHIKDDKQLRDVARVWKKLNVAPVTVILDGKKDNGVFEISQKTIEVINEINGTGLGFKVKPCTVTDEACSTIKITGGGDVQDIAFIAYNGSQEANVVLAKDYTWNWNGTVKVTDAAVAKITNEGTMANTAAAVLKTAENNATQNNVPLYNNGIWNVSGGILRVQFDVHNYGKVNIAKDAEYRQDGSGHVFRNWAKTKPERFLASGDEEKIGVVKNEGVFATVNSGKIFNYSLIEHADEDAKTYITLNQTSTADFGTEFTSGKQIGTINLPFSNKEEDNISINGSADKGFVSVTVTEKDMAETEGVLDASVVGVRVNYINVMGGVKKIASVSSQVKYLEINQPGTEVVWAVGTPTYYDGLILLSNVNIKLNTVIAAGVTYLGKNATMYVGGKFNNGVSISAKFNGSDTEVNKVATKWVGYYGDTSANVATNYVTY